MCANVQVSVSRAHNSWVTCCSWPRVLHADADLADSMRCRFVVTAGHDGAVTAWRFDVERGTAPSGGPPPARYPRPLPGHLIPAILFSPLLLAMHPGQESWAHRISLSQRQRSASYWRFNIDIHSGGTRLRADTLRIPCVADGGGHAPSLLSPVHTCLPPNGHSVSALSCRLLMSCFLPGNREGKPPWRALNNSTSCRLCAYFR